jgi:hypothetical protein
MDGMIDVTSAEPIEIVKAAYEFSVPQGLGFIHAEPGGLTDDEAQEILDRNPPNGRIVASMDYVKGRACKMTIFREGDRIFIRDNWFDHSDRDLIALLSRINVTPAGT